MKVLVDLISESALKPSQYRKLVKGWKSDPKMKALFQKFGDPRGYRIYIPFGDLTLPKKVSVDAEIELHLEEMGIYIEDYIKGIGKDKHGRLVKIGKFLKKDQKLKRIFDNDVRRTGSKLSNLLVVISRHPYDVAGVSTDRGWTSCMNLDGGQFHHKLEGEIKVGTMVAYLIQNKDRNINRPVARCLLKPFKSGRIKVYGADLPYPKDIPKLRKFLTDWLNKHVNKTRSAGLADLNDVSYNDGNSQFAYGVHTKKGKELLASDPDYVHAAVRNDPTILRELSTDLIIQNFLTALYSGMTASDLDSIAHVLPLLPTGQQQSAATFFPHKLQEIFGDGTEDDLIAIIQSTNKAVRYMDYYLELNPESRKRILIGALNNCKDKSCIDFLVRTYSDDYDAQDFLFSNNIPKSGYVYKSLGLLDTRADVLEVVRSRGTKVLIEGNVVHKIGSMFSEGTDDLADAIDDYYGRALSRGRYSNISRACPYELWRVCPQLILDLIDYDAMYACCTTYQVMGDKEPSPQEVVDMVNSCISRNPECSKHLAFSEIGNSEIICDAVYADIGYEEISRNISWLSLSPTVLAAAIAKDFEVPRHIPKRVGTRILDRLADALYERIGYREYGKLSDRWFRTLITIGMHQYYPAVFWMCENSYSINDMNGGVEIWKFVEVVETDLFRSMGKIDEATSKMVVQLLNRKVGN